MPAQTVPLSPSAARLIDRARLSVKKAEVARLVLPSVRFVANPNQDMPVGESRLGGLPDLPEDANWPGTANAALDFLLQINLSDVSNAQPGGPLPKSGLLSFMIARTVLLVAIRMRRQAGKSSFTRGASRTLSAPPCQSGYRMIPRSPFVR